MLCDLGHPLLLLARPRRKRSSVRLGSDDDFVNMIALGTFERADVETYACRRDSGEHHVSMAPRAGGALDSNVDAIGQGMRFRHDAFLIEAGAQHSQSPVMCLWGTSGDGSQH
jgi:hypothetical protein